ncbi:MAG: peptidase S10, partial [Chloroflexota bacterium]
MSAVDKTEKEEKKTKDKPAVEEKTSVTQHQITVKGKNLEYSVTTGKMVLKEEDEEKGEKDKATIFYIAYSLKTVEGSSKRPLTFSFNGGPGSSSVWLHMGVLGPRRVLMDDEGMALSPPFSLV